MSRSWPVLLVIGLGLAAYSGLLRAETDPPAWSIPVFVGALVVMSIAEALRRRARQSGRER